MKSQEFLEAESRDFRQWKKRRMDYITIDESWPETYAAFKRYLKQKTKNNKKNKMRHMRKLKRSSDEITESKAVEITDSLKAQSSSIPAPPIPSISPEQPKPTADEQEKENEKLKQELREVLGSLFNGWDDFDSQRCVLLSLLFSKKLV